MNKNEWVEYLKENMPEFHGTEEEKELRIATYIYGKLGENKSFDETYFFGTKKQQRKMYKLAQQERNLDKIAQSKIINCVTSTYLLQEILAEFNISSWIEKKDDHQFLIIALRDGRYIRADLVRDIHHIQARSKLSHFANLPSGRINYGLAIVPESEMEQIYMDIGYVKEKGELKDEKLKKLAQETQDMLPHQKLKMILQDKRVYKTKMPLEMPQIYVYYNWVLRKCGMEHNQNIGFFECFKQAETGKREYSICMYSQEQEELILYLYSHKEKKFVQVTPEQVLQLQQQGLVLGNESVYHKKLDAIGKIIEKIRKSPTKRQEIDLVNNYITQQRTKQPLEEERLT